MSYISGFAGFDAPRSQDSYEHHGCVPRLPCVSVSHWNEVVLSLSTCIPCRYSFQANRSIAKEAAPSVKQLVFWSIPGYIMFLTT